MRYIAFSRDKSRGNYWAGDRWMVMLVGKNGQSKASVRRQALEISDGWLDATVPAPQNARASAASIAANMRVLTEDKALEQHLGLLRAWVENTAMVYRAHDGIEDLLRRIEELSGQEVEKEAGQAVRS